MKNPAIKTRCFQRDSNAGLMELCGSSPAKAREERTETAVVTPLVALHQRRRGEMKQEENEKLARIAPGAWDVTGEKSDAHLRHGSSAGNGDEAGAAAFGHQVASDPLPALSCSSRSAGSAGPPVGRRASPEQATPVLAPESRDPAPNQRTDPVRAPASAVPPATAARSNKQRRPPAVRWTIEWTDDHRTSPEPLSPVETEPVNFALSLDAVKFYWPPDNLLACLLACLLLSTAVC